VTSPVGRLAGKTALVTGGASGFGEGMARKFAAEGARVIIADLNTERLEALGREGLGHYATATDVSRAVDIAALAGRMAEDGIDPPDIIVNNAGITHLPADLEAVTEDDFDRVFTVNCKSVYLMARRFVSQMKRRGSGVILNVASTAGLSPRPRLNWYNASKGWMITATKAMAVELAPHGIRVNALCPVAGETPLLSSFLGEDTPEMRDRFLSTIPLGRFSTPEDMGNAACYLCSDEASMITGVAMEVDGGRCI